MVTDADVSPDGAWVVLRTNTEVIFYRTRDLMARNVTDPARVSVESVGEPQGEGIALAAEGLVYLAGEGGGRGGTLASLRCTLR
jgi:hypothetical protein